MTHHHYLNMTDRNKNKIKAEINKAVHTVSGILKPTSEVKQVLEGSYKDQITEKVEKAHCTFFIT